MLFVSVSILGVISFPSHILPCICLSGGYEAKVLYTSCIASLRLRLYFYSKQIENQNNIVSNPTACANCFCRFSLLSFFTNPKIHYPTLVRQSTIFRTFFIVQTQITVSPVSLVFNCEYLKHSCAIFS